MQIDEIARKGNAFCEWYNTYMHEVPVVLMKMIETEYGKTAQLKTSGADPFVFNMDVVNMDVRAVEGYSYSAEIFGLCINLSANYESLSEPDRDDLIASGLFEREAEDSSHAWISGIVQEVMKDDRNEEEIRTSVLVRVRNIEMILFAEEPAYMEPGYRVQASVLLYGNLLHSK